MTSVINIRGGDTEQAREALTGLLNELNHRSADLVASGHDSWPGSPDLHLIADELPQLLADVDCRGLFRRVLSQGRKLGLRGVAYGGGETVVSYGGCPVIRDLLFSGAPLKHAHPANATSAQAAV